MINKLFGKMLSDMKGRLGLRPLEALASKAGTPINLMPMESGDMAAMGRKHKGTMEKTMPGILMAKMRLGERPVGGKQMGLAPRPLFQKKGS